MNGDNYDIVRAEGGFIVYVTKFSETPPEDGNIDCGNSVIRIFADSSSLLNYLHNELVGSN